MLWDIEKDIIEKTERMFRGIMQIRGLKHFQIKATDA